MALFDRGTVIIVGAGASVPFGLPTGIGFMEAAVKLLQDEASAIDQMRDDSVFPVTVPNIAPVIYATQFEGDRNKQINTGPCIAYLRKKADWLSRQTYDTIDDAIRHHPEEAQLLKVLVACGLLKATHRVDQDGQWKIRADLASRGSGEHRNWVHSLVNLVRGELLDDSNGFSNGEKIKIINFNYDCILEKVLSEVWSSSEEIKKLTSNVTGDPADWQQVFEIIHPHGCMGTDVYEFYASELPQKLHLIAGRIKVVRDLATDDHQILKQRFRAKEACENAQEIYAMGFAFAKTNCDLLGLCKNGTDLSNYAVSEQTLSYINYSGEYGLRDRVQRLAFPKSKRLATGGNGRQVVERRNETGEKLSIHQALVAGFLGEMPS